MDSGVARESYFGTASGSPSPLDFQTFARQKLSGLFFSGSYNDRVFVDGFNGYRDRVVVDPDESAAVRTFRSVERKARKRQHSILGIQRSGDDTNLCVDWTVPGDPPPFGTYWFLVDRVRFHGGGLDFVLRVLRSKETEVQRLTCRHCRGRLDITPTDPLSVSDIATAWQSMFLGSIKPDVWCDNVKCYLTMKNASQCCKFIFLLVLATVSGLFTFIQNMVPMLNKTILAVATLIHQLTPFLLSCLETLNKVIGACFLIINRMWGDVVQAIRSRPPPPPKPAVTMVGASYWSKQSIRVKEIETTGSLFLNSRGPRYPYLRNDINRPYLQD